MKLITLDAETFYGGDYTLSKLTTEAYVRDSRFECIMFGIKEDAKPTYTVVGADISEALHDLELHKHACVIHHAHFDALILSHHYGIRPKIIFDTLAMGRAEVGSVASRGLSLGSLSTHLGLGEKGHEVVLAKGKHLADFTPQELADYRRYCCNDVDLTYAIYSILRPRFCTKELQLIDLTTRLFTEPILELDVPLLAEYKELVLANKEMLIAAAGVDKKDLTSNPKFAQLLEDRGINQITHPDILKDSKTAKNEDGTPKKTYAFAKGDQFMMDLLECEDEEVQALAEARVGVKTSIAETRAQRLIDMQQNGPACIYLNYWGAEQTGRHSGGGRSNFQNLGRSQTVEEKHVQFPVYTPDGRAEVIDPGVWGLTDICTTTGYWPERKIHRIGLRDCVRAPEGYVLVVGDSSNIEARMVCWLAGQEDILQQYRDGADLYCLIASDIYGKTITKADTKARQLGKVVTLGCGFGMGKNKFFDTATGAQWRIDIDRDTTDTAVDAFRAKYDKVAAYWRFLNDQAIPAMADGREMWADTKGTIRTTAQGFIMPNGRTLRYPNLHQRKNPDPDSYFKREWVFDVREGSRIIKSRTYGGHAAENLTQAAARIIVMDQAVDISRRYKVALLVHDEVVCCVPEEEAEECEKFMLEVMSTPPKWAPDLPVAAETGVNQVYSLAK